MRFWSVQAGVALAAVGMVAVVGAPACGASTTNVDDTDTDTILGASCPPNCICSTDAQCASQGAAAAGSPCCDGVTLSCQPTDQCTPASCAQCACEQPVIIGGCQDVCMSDFCLGASAGTACASCIAKTCGVADPAQCGPPILAPDAGSSGAGGGDAG